MLAMTKFILDFDQVGEISQDRVGGKGCALVLLRQAGFPVPPGFVVTTDAYRAFVATDDLDTLIAATLTDSGPTASRAHILEVFERTEMPSPIITAVHNAYMLLGEGEVAVRSSSLAEDGGVTSFAGQHETFLGVVGSDAVLVAIRRCWASLWSERALAYRHRMGFECGVPAMAVVVQRMVSAAQSGVAFTLDPVSGRRDVVVVEAIIGRGESLVGGQVTPHRYVIQREHDCLRAYTMNEGVLDDSRLMTVVRLAQEVEAWASRPQDIEWALDSAGCIYLLQARPVTVFSRDQASFAKIGVDEDTVRWTRDNVGEVLPDPVTPLSWSVLDPLGNQSFAQVLRRLGVRDCPGTGLFGRFHGRIYFNQTLFQGMMSRFYPSRVGWRAAPRLATTILRALSLLWRLPAESKDTIDVILEQYRAEREIDLASLTTEDALTRLSGWLCLGVAAMEVHLVVSVVAELLYQALDRLLERWSDVPATATALTGGLKGIRSAEAGQDLLALAQQICQDNELRKLVLTASPETLPCRLAEVEAGQALLTQIEAFLVEHGHSAQQEFELSVPRWRDEPTTILSMLQAQVRTTGQPAGDDPAAVRRAAVVRVEQSLSLMKRWIFRRGLNLVRKFTVMRENLKYHFVIAHSRLRDLYLALAEHLVTAGYLTDPEDVFFLGADEVTALIEVGLGPGDRDVSERVSERRRALEIDRERGVDMALDQWADGRLVPVARPDETGDSDNRVLCGFAASPGSYTGRARVLLTPTSGADIEPGEVLVAPATTPGWAPLLLTAGALVTEIGGTLSHGAIIAREYGLPAVLNVADATRQIHTGQLVQVDGCQGTVRLLKEVQ